MTIHSINDYQARSTTFTLRRQHEDTLSLEKKEDTSLLEEKKKAEEHWEKAKQSLMETEQSSMQTRQSLMETRELLASSEKLLQQCTLPTSKINSLFSDKFVVDEPKLDIPTQQQNKISKEHIECASKETSEELDSLKTTVNSGKLVVDEPKLDISTQQQNEISKEHTDRAIKETSEELDSLKTAVDKVIEASNSIKKSGEKIESLGNDIANIQSNEDGSKNRFQEWIKSLVCAITGWIFVRLFFGRG